ncbi:MAG: TRAP transporter substrate-binding protein [Rhodospirillales bacterium]|nr:TRAP transporter substrate-binding protein [Rhodospirillales bacterium]
MTHSYGLCLGLAGTLVLALATPGQAVELKYAHQSSEQHVNHRLALLFADTLKAETKGEITVKLFPNKQLGGERDEIEGILIGTVGAAHPASAVLANWVPELNIANMPFVFRDLPHFEKVWQGPLKEKMEAASAKKGIRFVCAMTTGIRNIMSKKPINTIADMKGLKIRAIENPVHVATFNAMGANAAAIAYPEVYSSLQTGVVDGADAANSNYYEQKFYEVAPNWAIIQWLVFTNTLIMSEKTYQSFTPSQKKAVGVAGDAACKLQNTAFLTEDDEKLKLLVAQNVKVTRPERQPFIDASKKVYDQFLKTDAEKEMLKIIQDTK